MALESYYLNGGFIGKAFDLASTDTYSETTFRYSEYIGTSHASVNGTADIVITLPTETLSTDTIFLHVLYENSSTTRPTISGFTILQSRNGTFQNAGTTQILYQGTTSSSTITIPNGATFSGGVASALVVRNVTAVNTSLGDAAISTSAVFSRTLENTQSFAVMVAKDAANDQFQSWTDTGTSWSNESPYVSTDGALSGRAAFVGITTGATGPSSFRTGYPSNDGTSGSLYAVIDITGAEIEDPNFSNKKNSGIWSLPAVLDSVEVSPYRVTPSVTTVDENGLVTFDIVATGIADGTTLYWTTASATDFVTNNGSFTVTNEQGSFSVSPVSDITTEGTESFDVNIRTGSVSGTIVATSGTIFINDTSTTPRSFKSSLVDNSSVNTSAWTQQSVFDTTPTINNTGYTVTSSAITIPESGVYLCTFSCYFTSTVERANIGVGFGINGIRENEISGSNYIRALDGHNEATTSLTTIFELSIGDEINLFFIGLALTGTVNLIGSASYITINKIA